MRVENITVGKGRISYVVRLAPDERYTSEDLMERVLEDFPCLSCHTCVNAQGPTFAAVMNRTSRAHLLEHMVIDLQVREFQERNRSPLFVGNTQWVDEVAGVARVQVSYQDDLVALRAFKQAIVYLDHLTALTEKSPSAGSC